MAGKSKIEWCTDSWNPTVGCSVISAGCTNCYAMKMAQRLTRIAQQHCETVCRLEHEPHAFDHYVGTTKLVNGKPVWTGVLRLAPQHIITVPLRWKRPRKIFVNSMSDLFHESIPDEWIDRIFAVMAMAPQHTFQVLTKRSKRMRDYFEARSSGDPWAEAADYIADAIGLADHPFVLEPRHIPLRNVWLGVSTENQASADERIPDLLATPAAVRFISAEPLLGPIHLNTIDLPGGEFEIAPLGWKHLQRGDNTDPRLDWVIIGGESGQGARPMVIGWAKEIVRQCKAAGVPCFVKQLGAKPANREGQPHAISDRKGAMMAEWPEELRVREMPKGGL